MIKVRPAELSDLHDLGTLWVEMVGEEFGNNVWADELYWERVIGVAIEGDKNFVMFIAEDDNTPVGFIMGQIYYEPSDSKMHGISQHIYVVPEYRHTGVAIRLYHTLAKTMKSMGVEVMSLYCIPSRSEFWARKGFKPIQTMFSKELKNA